MTKKENDPDKLSPMARDFFGFKGSVGLLGAVTILPYFLLLSLIGLVLWHFNDKRDLMQYGRMGKILYYLAPSMALIGLILGFLGPKWRLAMGLTYYSLMFPFVLYLTVYSDYRNSHKLDSRNSKYAFLEWN